MSDLVIAKKYLDILNIRIKSQNNYSINISCPLCGEGNSKFKARGYVLYKDSQVSYFCHNCPDGNGNFYNFLAQQESTLAKQYYKEIKLNKLQTYSSESSSESDAKEVFKIKEMNADVLSMLKEPLANPHNFIMKLFDKAIFTKTRFEESVDIEFELKELPLNAIEYLQGRGFKSEDYKDFRFCEEEDSILIPFWFKKSENLIYGFQARCIGEKRFHNQNFRTNPKITNLEYLLSLPVGSDIYCFEAEFDRISTLIDNSTAIIGKTLSAEAEKLLKDYNLIICTDADEEGDKSALRYAKAGKQVLIHDLGMYHFKDNNKLLEIGTSKEEITKYVKSHIKMPNRAIMELRKRGYN